MCESIIRAGTVFLQPLSFDCFTILALSSLVNLEFGEKGNSLSRGESSLRLVLTKQESLAALSAFLPVCAAFLD